MTTEQLRRYDITPEKALKIVDDAISFGFLTELCSGCSKTYEDCGGCPCGSSLGWHPSLKEALNKNK